MIDAGKRGGQVEVFLRKLPFKVILIVRGKDLDAHGMHGDAAVNQRLILYAAAHKRLDSARRQPPVGVHLLAGNGIIARNADALRNIKIQKEIIMEGKIVNFDIK